jgi:hypothetical protein
MPRLARFTAPLEDLDTYKLFEDFDRAVDATLWVSTLTDLGTVTHVTNVQGGIALITPSDGTVADNDEAYYASPIASFLPTVNRPMLFRSRVSFQEAATNAANVAAGWASAVAADLLVDNGGGLRASGTVIALEKRDGETEWRLTTRNGATVTSQISQQTAGVADDLATWQELEIFVEHWTATQATVSARVDGIWLTEPTRGLRIVQSMLYSGATAMQAFLAVKNGSANNQLVYADYVYSHQLRR